MSSIPDALQEALARNKKALLAWNGLTTIARRDFVTWIESAKQEETRHRRVEKAIDMLRSGKRRPCCYAVVPMNLYTALNANQKAKAQWKTLTPDERRDLIAWINKSKDQMTNTSRIEKVCTLLREGKSSL